MSTIIAILDARIENSVRIHGEKPATLRLTPHQLEQLRKHTAAMELRFGTYRHSETRTDHNPRYQGIPIEVKE